MENKEAGFLVLRYFVLIVLAGLLSWGVFYVILTPVTVYPTYWMLSILFDNTSLLTNNLLFFGGEYAQIIPACVAGAAYYLLLLLNLTTPMDLKRRVKSILFLVCVFLIFNVVRILIFSGLLVSGSQYFDEAHLLVWYLGSTLLVVLLWFGNVWLFEIEEMPIYSDFKKILDDIIGRKR